MANKKVIVSNGKERRIVQRSVIPNGFTYVEDYKAPDKVQENKQTTKKSTKKKQTKKDSKK
ncbi:hypothetical protein [Virgibacillus halodenitrificans]|uniref:Uncharacterized protein n=1 Tax=Virgibacillus halodenitrificans TaxID=1482 RepID=A0ABR7VN00_VIRHA|nr:hypothetical protein [Virgibacillus halodenitrificans]MBD1223288.1 hypothetical protein [Virgibacillus halodenitrificans]